MKRALVAFAAVLVPAAASGVACSMQGEIAQPVGPNVPSGEGGPLGEGDATVRGGVDAGQEDAPCTQIPIPDGGVVTVTGTVRAVSDAGTKPIADAMVAAEYGGLYATWCDLSHASPYYVFGAVTDQNGRFTMKAKDGILGFHSFATGYLYTRSRLDTGDGGTDTTLDMEAVVATAHIPVVSGAAFDKTTVSPGEALTFSAQVKAGDATTDPLSDEILLVEPSQSWASELDPPSVGKKDDFPDGLWKKTFPAPQIPGTYTYYFSATAAYCETSSVQTFQVTVR